MSERITLIPCELIVATAAPAAPIFSGPTRTISPTTFTAAAIATK